MPDISRLAIIFTISSNTNANSNINKLINSFISSKRKRVRVPDVRRTCSGHFLGLLSILLLALIGMRIAILINLLIALLAGKGRGSVFRTSLISSSRLSVQLKVGSSKAEDEGMEDDEQVPIAADQSAEPAPSTSPAPVPQDAMWIPECDLGQEGVAT